ncbi:MAG: cyclic nucleotide-binding domain-containing protein [Chloroflexota bacterium]
MADQKLDRLKSVPIFSLCSKAELRSLAMNTDEVSLSSGRTLITEGESNHTFFILLRGEAEVHVDDRTVGRLGPGDFFGEISMLDRGKATATVISTSPMDALIMSHAQFRDAVRAHDDTALKVIAAMAQRLRRDGAAGA